MFTCVVILLSLETAQIVLNYNNQDFLCDLRYLQLFFYKDLFKKKFCYILLHNFVSVQVQGFLPLLVWHSVWLCSKYDAGTVVPIDMPTTTN
ncbi:hypothetical protein M758_7G149600 [Ceratodon purpureus]|uniref:Secreted protein n=1 Tax=Ceratodon purpureus TaxID=3225 RepID=A0A8T0H5U2_CERPU|nr:hypothetical protein KC19_7G128400 [Ceratodon purpureus]KAG0611563.1 hypothetical protein M758_7G149600 [Ceratodon purpureus]